MDALGVDASGVLIDDAAEDAIDRGPNWLPWYDDFLTALKEEFSVVHAASVVGCTAKTCYRHRKKHAGFAAAWTAAWNTVVGELEASAMKRAIKGTLVPILYKDKVITGKREYETSLTIFMLKRNWKDKYGDELVADEKDAREKAREFREAMRAIDESVPESEEE